MKITMRLYRIHDLDLIYLHKMPEVSIQKIIRSALKRYVYDRRHLSENKDGKEVVRQPIPRIEHTEPLPKSALIHIYLNEGADDDVIEWLNAIPKGYRNGMLKNIVRNYISFPMTVPYELEMEDRVSEPAPSQTEAVEAKEKSQKPARGSKKPVYENIEDDVLNSPLPSSEAKKGIKMDEGDEILNRPSQKVETKQNKPQAKPEPKLQTKPQPPTDNDDPFGDFEQMMSGL